MFQKFFSTKFSIINLIKSVISLGTGIFLALALITYNENDPSFNVASNGLTENFAGSLGAYIADPLLQFFGVSAAAFVLIPICWSYIIFKEGKIKFLFSKVLVGLISAISFSILINDYTIPSGAIGILLHKLFINYISKDILQIIASVIVFFGLYFSLSLSIDTWLKILKIFYLPIKRTFALLAILFTRTKQNMAKAEETAPLPKQKKRVAPAFSFQNNSDAEEEIIQPIETKIITPQKKENKAVSFVKQDRAGFILPSTELLQEVSINKDLLQQNKSVIKQNTEELMQVLADFGVMGDIIGAASGPVVTLYELEPAAGTKSSRIIGLSDDISRSMRATSARIAVIPGRNAIGIELPNKQRETVYLRELLESDEYNKDNYDLPIVLGKDISGKVIVADLARMPHLLVAGTTGSGKSVAINTMILSLVYALTPDQCKFIMVDPKMLELSVYDGIPHLLTNVVTEPGKAVVALKWVVKEMESRYRLMSNLGVRNIHNYNERIKTAIANGEIIQRTVQTGFNPETGQPIIEQVPLDMKTLPFIVVIVDEMADLMIVAGKEIEGSIQRLAQMARAAGIHIIMATQRPSVDVITGVIKANFPTRISFQVTSKIDSRTILGEQGAEQLLGKGDMLYMAGGSKITRIHSPFVLDSEVERIVSYLKSQAQPEYITDVTAEDANYTSSSSTKNDNSFSDELYQQAIEVVRLEGKASTSFIQRCLKIGYNRAATIMEQMEKEGLVSKPNHVGKREIFL